MKRNNTVSTWTLRATPAEAKVIEEIIRESDGSISDAIRTCIRTYSRQQEEAERIAAVERRMTQRIDAVGAVLKELVAVIRNCPMAQVAESIEARRGLHR